MVKATRCVALGIVSAFFMGASMSAHEVSVHVEITKKAIDYLLGFRRDLNSCSAELKDHLARGVTDEDDFLFGPLGQFFFHFRPPLNDEAATAIKVHAEGTCDSLLWGETGAVCTARLSVGEQKLEIGVSNALPYNEMVRYLREPAGSANHTIGLIGLGHYLHLLQDLTSPAHTRNDAHPHFHDYGDKLRFDDPSAFEVVNVGRPIPFPGGPLLTFTSRQEAFDQLRIDTARRFWSEKNTLTGPPAGPAMATFEDGYALDAERRQIARRVPFLGPLLNYYTIDDVVAKAQFDELARMAVRYTASMIDHIIRTENLSLCAPVTATRYRAVMIPPPYAEWSASWWPSSINSQGHVSVGYGGYPYSAYIWNGTVNSAILTQDASGLTHLNDSGHLAFTSLERGYEPIGSKSRALIWNGTSLQDLGTLGGPTSGVADFNNRGQVIGGSTLASGQASMFRWNGATMEPFSWGPPGSKPSAIAMNDVGHVCGVYYIEHPYPTPVEGYAVVWDGVESRTLPSIDGKPFRCTDMSDDGSMVGFIEADPLSGVASGRAYLWNGASFVPLGHLGGTASWAQAINANGEVVGSSHLATQLFWGRESHGFHWRDGIMRDLNDFITWGEPGWILASAVDINNAGQIIGTAIRQGTEYPAGRAVYQAVRLDPIR